MRKFLAIIAVTTLVISCSKSTEDLAPQATKKIKRVDYQNGNYAEVTYQPDGKVKTVVNKMNQYVYTKTFTHTPGKVSYLSVLGGKKNEIGEYTIVSGKVSSFTWTYFDANEAPIATYTETYSYNAQGLLSKRLFQNGYYYTFSYNKDGDCIEHIYYDANDVPNNKYIHAYTTQDDRFPWFTEDDDSGSGFLFPARSKHLRKSTKALNMLNNGSVIYDYQIQHQLDKDGYVVKSVFTNLVDNNSSYSVMNVFE